MKKNNKAQAMVIAFIYLSVIALTGISMMIAAGNLNQLAIRNLAHYRGLYAAESGLIRAHCEYYRERVYGEAVPSMTWTFPETSIGATAISTDQPQCTIAVSYVNIVAGSDTPPTRLVRAVVTKWFQNTLNR